VLLASGGRSFPDLHSQSRRISLFSMELYQGGNGEFSLWDLCFVTMITPSSRVPLSRACNKLWRENNQR